MIEPRLCCAAIFSLLRLWIWSSKRRNDGRIKMIKTYAGGSPVYSDCREGSGKAILRKKEKRKKKRMLRSKERHLLALDGRREWPSSHPSGFSVRTGCRRLWLGWQNWVDVTVDIRQGPPATLAELSLLSGESIKNCKLTTQGPKTNVSATFQSIVLPQNMQCKFHCSQMVLIFLSSLLETLFTSLFPVRINN